VRIVFVLLLAGCLGFTPAKNKRAGFVNLAVANVGLGAVLAGAAMSSYERPTREPGLAIADTGLVLLGVGAIGMITSIVTAIVIGVPHDQ
jgi:hypothetical protein